MIIHECHGDHIEIAVESEWSSTARSSLRYSRKWPTRRNIKRQVRTPTSCPIGNHFKKQQRINFTGLL